MPSAILVIKRMMIPIKKMVTPATPMNEKILNFYIFLMSTAGNYKIPTASTMKY
mgnify:FL=1